jgi:hypothetical protein
MGRARERSRPTYVDILSQQLVRNAVFVDDIVVHAGAGGRRAEEESKQSSMSSQPRSSTMRFRDGSIAFAPHLAGMVTHPPRKAPTGFLTGAGTTTSCLITLLVWKPRTGRRWMLRAAVRVAGRRSRDAICVNGSRGSGAGISRRRCMLRCAQSCVGGCRRVRCEWQAGDVVCYTWSSALDSFPVCQDTLAASGKGLQPTCTFFHYGHSYKLLFSIPFALCRVAVGPKR